MKKVCLKCYLFKEIPRGLVFCEDCRRKIYEESSQKNLLQQSDKTQKIPEKNQIQIKRSQKI